jgi:hydroxyacyl-ACP dehydratase HTD2-like protein with hotdog domain
MATPDIESVQAGDALPDRQLNCDTVQLFLYNAALWNAHRIHFDAPYAEQVEGYPGLVVAGPLIGDWLVQCAVEWMGEDGELVSFEFSNRWAAYAGDPLVSRGTVVSADQDSGLVTLDLQVLNAEGRVIAPGRAVVRLPVG